ncbi:MAG: nucleotide pyrophosphohydrolase [Rickettsiales bacterium]|nr:nucleotide pyrophosphohydrolase [Rickettsiales bacterium]|tara:strand:- start:2016 stop:2360 length:345 start_codon:yes stop_codon:yes gene_type:complete
MDIKKLKSSLRRFAKDRDWNQFHTLKNIACSISIESSELLELFQWREIKGIDLKDPNLKVKISDEVADIFLYLIRFSDIAEINLEEVCLNKIKKNQKKYPISLSKGNSKKYTEL